MQVVLLALLAVCLAAEEPAVNVSPARIAGAIREHTVRSPYQAETTLRVLVPEPLDAERRYPVIYLLPVEAERGAVYGDGLEEVRKHALHNRHQVIFAAPTFSQLPWYADHPTRRDARQESYFVKAIVPAVEKHYPAIQARRGRLLLGFSKSGWGAWSLILRNREVFEKAASWDAPLMMDRPGRYGSGPIFETEANFRKYQVSVLVRQHRDAFASNTRLILLGYGGFEEDTRQAHDLLWQLKIPHGYRNGPKRKHDWHSGWVSEAVELLLAE